MDINIIGEKIPNSRGNDHFKYRPTSNHSSEMKSYDGLIPKNDAKTQQKIIVNEDNVMSRHRIFNSQSKDNMIRNSSYISSGK